MSDHRCKFVIMSLLVEFEEGTHGMELNICNECRKYVVYDDWFPCTGDEDGNFLKTLKPIRRYYKYYVSNRLLDLQYSFPGSDLLATPPTVNDMIFVYDTFVRAKHNHGFCGWVNMWEFARNFTERYPYTASKFRESVMKSWPKIKIPQWLGIQFPNPLVKMIILYYDE